MVVGDRLKYQHVHKIFDFDFDLTLAKMVAFCHCCGVIVCFMNVSTYQVFNPFGSCLPFTVLLVVRSSSELVRRVVDSFGQFGP